MSALYGFLLRDIDFMKGSIKYSYMYVHCTYILISTQPKVSDVGEKLNIN